MTRRQQDVLDFLERWFRDNRISPSYQEICEGIGVQSKAVVHRIIHALARRGLISLEGGHGRKRAIIPPDRDALSRAARKITESAELSPAGVFLVHPVDFQSLVQAVDKSNSARPTDKDLTL